MNQLYEDEVSIKEIFSTILKRKKIVMISIILTTLLSSAYAYMPILGKKVEFDASSSISIVYNYQAPQNPEQIGEGYVYYQDRLQNTMIPTINGYAQSLSILRSVINELELKDSKGQYIEAKKLAKDIKIESKDNSNLIVITAKYNSEQIAADIANKIPEKLIQMAKSNPELSNYKIDIVDFAIASETKESSKVLPIGIGIVLGIILGIGIVFIMIYLKGTIQLQSQIRNIGLDIDMTVKTPIDKDFQNKIISISKLSDAKSLIVGIESLSEINIFKDFFDLTRNHNIDAEIISYYDDIFFTKVKEVDKTIIVIYEDISKINMLKEIAKLFNKYNIESSVIYIKK